jgi:localization factor PodJL
MTRRILRSFSDTPDDMTPAREQWTSNGSGNGYSNGHGYAPAPEPRPTASRRDTEDMLAHVARSESESNDVYRRIEEQLRNVARRLESTERNQSENNRAMSKAASEINVAAREQAQSFDQLGGSVMSLADRLERVERTTAGDGTRDAIKGLHQGLSRLAEQISNTANQSASQVSALATNLESLVGRLAQARSETEATARALEQRITQIDARAAQISEVDHKVALIDQRLSNVSAIDDRLRSVERNAQSVGDAVSHALQSLETSKDDSAAALRRDSETASAIARLEDNVSKLEQRGTDPAIDRRLSGIERSLSDIVGRFETPAARDGVDDNIKRLAQRIEAAEARQRDQVAELRAAMNDAAARHVDVLPHSALTGGQAPPFPQAFDAPPFPDAPHGAEHQQFQVSADPFAPAFEGAPAPFGSDSVFGNADPFAAQPPPPPLPAAESDTYLSAARRSARAAAAQAEAERGSRIGGFSWGAAAAAATDANAAAKPGSKKTYVWIAIIALMVVVALAVGVILSQKLSATSTHTVSVLFNKPGQPATPAANPALLPPTDGGDVTPAQSVPPAPLKPLASHDVKPAPVHAVPGAVAPTATPPTATPPQQSAALTPLDKLTALANAGNAKAELVVGLKYLDGDGVAASEPDAAKWLERAAEQGMAVAQYRLGTMYERGRGVPADAAKAVHWYQLAAQAGNRKAMHNLAVAYASGTGTAKNLAEAARWFSKAAALGLSDSEFNLAVLYERGLGVPQSLLDAFKWYSIAAAGGDTESKSRIDALATQLSADDKAAAQHAADAFHAQPLDPKANVPPQMGDVAG